MTRIFPLAPMSGLILGLTVMLWAVPIVFFAGHYVAPLPGLAPVGGLMVTIYAWVWLWWRPSRFEVGPTGLTAVFPLRRRQTEWHAIEKVERIDADELKRRYGRLLRVGAGGLWGGFGWLWAPGGTWVEFYISSMHGYVLIERSGMRPLLITPDRPDEFVALLNSRR